MAMDARSAGIRLRPLAIGDVLDETFRVYRRQFLAFLTAMAVVIVPTAVAGLLVILLTGVASMSAGREPSMAQVIVLLATVIPLVVVSSLARVLAGAAAVRIASDTILGRPVDVRAAYRHAFQRMGALLWSSLLIGLATGLLVITCIGAPFAVYLGLGWALVYPAIVIEGLGGTDGMRRSWELVRHHRWRLLACVVLIGLIMFLLISIPSALFSFVSGILMAVFAASEIAFVAIQIGNAAFQALGETLFGSIAYITITLLYYDLLVRKEAFDLQQRAAAGLPASVGLPASAELRPSAELPPAAESSPPTRPGAQGGAPRIPPPPLAPPDR